MRIEKADCANTYTSLVRFNTAPNVACSNRAQSVNHLTELGRQKSWLAR